MGLSVAEALLSGPAEIAIVGPDDDPRTADLLRAALHAAPPGAVFALGSGLADRATRSRCSPPVRWSPAGRRPTCAAASPAWPRSQPRPRRESTRLTRVAIAESTLVRARGLDERLADWLGHGCALCT